MKDQQNEIFIILHLLMNDLGNDHQWLISQKESPDILPLLIDIPNTIYGVVVQNKNNKNFKSAQSQPIYIKHKGHRDTLYSTMETKTKSRPRKIYKTNNLVPSVKTAIKRERWRGNP